jgi:hypothetical protein
MSAKQRTSSISFSEKVSGDWHLSQSPGQESYPGPGLPASPNEESSGDSDSEYPKDPIVPPSHSHRTVVLCFDGTGGLLVSTQRFNPANVEDAHPKVISSTMTSVFLPLFSSFIRLTMN